jgi:1-acyl-sn-glycerol-3-phosphate acyltransferase
VTPIYRFGSRLFEAGFRALGIDLRSTGHERIPTEGPVILASNHIGYLDFCFVSLAAPRPLRQVHFLARNEFFEKPVVGTLLRRLEQIPVDVHGDPRASAAAAQQALEEGKVIGVHPEGTISPSFVPRRAKSGTIRLAEATGATIVPVALWGSQRLLTKWRKPTIPPRGVVVSVRYGEPYEPEGRTAMARTADLMARITDLVGEVQRTYPQRPGPPPDDWWMPAHLGGSALTPEEAEARIDQQMAERRARRRGSDAA